jgi:hypothetical protein
VGLKLELVSRNDEAKSQGKACFRLRVMDPKKRSNKHKENEAIQFEFDLKNDNADMVAGDMVCAGPARVPPIILMKNKFRARRDSFWRTTFGSWRN